MSTRFRRLALAGLLSVHAALLAYSAVWQSPTLCEPGHLAGGVSIWKLGRFDVYRVNPPLVRTVAAVPVLLATPQLDWRHYSSNPNVRCEAAMGRDFFTANGRRSFMLLTLARSACIPFSVLGALICFAWARDLYGRAAGFIAATLWCFCPNVLGHGALITPDVAGAALGAATCYAFWRWLKAPGWRRAVLLGVALGLAELAKFTLFIFYPLWPLLWLVYRWKALREMRWRGRFTEALQLAAGGVLSLYVINAAYLFEGSFRPLGEYRFQSSAFSGARAEHPQQFGNRFAASIARYVPVPLPKNYVQGIDTQKIDFERRLQSYWAGKWHSNGTWFYYLYGLGVKLPVGTLALSGLAVLSTVFWRSRNGSWRDELVVIAPAGVVLLLVSSQTGMNSHFRYVLPTLPFMFIWTAKLGRSLIHLPNESHQGAVQWRIAVPAGAALALCVFSSLAVYPHSLSYFNEIAGGPAANPPPLLDSNIGWGQDLHFAKRWLDRHPEAKSLNMAAFTLIDPRLAGIDFMWPTRRGNAPLELQRAVSDPPGVPPGWYAIDVNFLHGAMRLMPDGQGQLISSSDSTLAFETFRHLRPVGRAGYSIYFYEVPVEENPLIDVDSAQAAKQ